jgi:hypothetical protein
VAPYGRSAYVGAHFDSWSSTGDRVRASDRFTADDLVAVRFRSVQVLPRRSWAPKAQALGADDAALPHRLLSIRAAAGLPEEISVLRVFEVIVWADGKTAASESALNWEDDTSRDGVDEVAPAPELHLFRRYEGPGWDLTHM